MSTYNGGVNCHNTKHVKPNQDFEGWMSYLCFWFKKDIWAMTLGGGEMSNLGRYLTLLPPLNNATAASSTPYFTENVGDRAMMHDGTITLDYMPAQFITFRLEESYRYSDEPYWTGHGGITPPGGNNGNPADHQCEAGGDSHYGYVYTNSNTGIGVAGMPLPLRRASSKTSPAGTLPRVTSVRIGGPICGQTRQRQSWQSWSGFSSTLDAGLMSDIR
ncbi:MAG TPA: hypothetical protein VME23_21100 [Terracidiphilus sp.]|nr:hypothetical protein [Terracidiphilus sp.]